MLILSFCKLGVLLIKQRAGTEWKNLTNSESLSFSCCLTFASKGNKAIEIAARWVVLSKEINLKKPRKLKTLRLGALILRESKLLQSSNLDCSSRGQLEMKLPKIFFYNNDILEFKVNKPTKSLEFRWWFEYTKRNIQMP